MWNACESEPVLWLRWIECRPGIAAWLQFGGTLLAVLATIGISQYQIAIQRRDERLRKEAAARSLAFLVAPHVARIVIATDGIRSEINDQECGMLRITPSVASTDSAVARMTFGVEPHRELLLRAGDLPSETALNMVMLFNYVEDFDAYIEAALPSSRHFDGDGRAKFVGDTKRKFQSIESVLRKFRAQLDEIVGPLDDVHR